MAHAPGERKRPSSEADGRAAEAVTRHGLLKEGTHRLAEARVENARREAEWLLADVLGRSRALLYAQPSLTVAPEEARVFRERLRRRIRGEPLQYVLGHADFFGLRLAVTPAVLIPRSETEEVVEEALRRLAEVPHPRVLDIGTGSGCIALAIQAERPDAEVHACDVSRDALTVARTNAATHDLEVQFFHADVLEAAAHQVLPRSLDLLVSNPPYVPDDEAATLPVAVRDHEPATALFSGGDPLRFYRLLARLAPRLLTPGGHLVLETHADYAGEVAALLREGELSEVAIMQDAFGRERIAAGRRPAASEET